MIKRLSFLLVLIFMFWALAWAQVTGKISGVVTNAETGEPLVGAQVMITSKWVDDREVKLSYIMGAVADRSGRFFIINVPPGFYTVKVQMMGFETVVYKKFQVSVNRTAELNVKMKPTVIKGKTIVVKAERVEIKKDQTSSIRNVSSKTIEKLPVESVDQVVSMQPGVVVGHFRGGRSGEVLYLLDGIQVNESFGYGKALDVNPDVVEEVEVITGTFNAEYGRAMSGVVNVVTKEGGNSFRGMLSLNAGNYVTTHDNIFIGLKPLEIRAKDLYFSLSGPLRRNRLFFFVNGQLRSNLGHLNGIYRFNVDDYSDFHGDSTEWYSEHTGTGEYVPMDWSENTRIFGKISWKAGSRTKISLISNYGRSRYQYYDHSFKYNPYGRATDHSNSQMLALLLNQSLSSSIFHEFKVSWMRTYFGSYVYKDPTDKRYVHDGYMRSFGCGFYTGGQQKHHVERVTKDFSVKYDLTKQLNTNHCFKTGFLYTSHYLYNSSKTVRNKYEGSDIANYFYYDSTKGEVVFPYYEPVILPDSTLYSDIYTKRPFEFSWYIQDKMEFEEMVINAGVRFDYFDPNTVYPSQWRNPANQLHFEDPEKMSKFIKADPKYQLSPRIGISYRLGRAALLHFSYGHFFQMPPLYSVYQNHDFVVPPYDFATVMGNPQIRAQKTVQYEIGLWQELTANMNLEVVVFYRDIYDLLSTKVITTFNQIRYGLYTNKDYGNARGLELKYDFEYGKLLVSASYTFMHTRGNADSPTFSFDRAGNNMDPVNKFIPMSWDQRHTVNIAVSYSSQNAGSTVRVRYDSGTPYTWTPIPENPLSSINILPNNDYMPYRVNVDLNAYYNFIRGNRFCVGVKLLIYNLLDRLNEVWVYGTTGRAYTVIARENEIENHKSNFNDYWDRIKNPAMFSAPRFVKLGIEVKFY